MKQRISITLPTKVLTALMEDNPTSQDFLSRLPIILTLEDYNHIEKISDLPKRLTLNGAPEGSTPSAGDLTVYGPWGNLAIFYKSFSYSRGLVLLGKLESGIEMSQIEGAVQARFEII